MSSQQQINVPQLLDYSPLPSAGTHEEVQNTSREHSSVTAIMLASIVCGFMSGQEALICANSVCEALAMPSVTISDLKRLAGGQVLCTSI